MEACKEVLTLKNVSKTCEFELARRIKERKVLKPPLRTAGPIFVKAWRDLSFFVPVDHKKKLSSQHFSQLLLLLKDATGLKQLKLLTFCRISSI